MKYMGSKARIAKHILPIILNDRKEGQWYVEPFVGGANMIDKVDGNRIGADSNRHVISSLILIQNAPKAIPFNNKVFTESRYNLAAKKARENSELTCIESFALIAYSFGAKWIGGWARGSGRDYVEESYRNAQKQSPKIKGVLFINQSYDELEILPQSIIYCDPPYANTTKYKDNFDHDKFWEWCREKCKEGHKVFISEYNAPDDFVCVWQQELNVSVAKSGKHKKATEKLFIHESQLRD